MWLTAASSVNGAARGGEHHRISPPEPGAAFCAGGQAAMGDGSDSDRHPCTTALMLRPLLRPPPPPPGLWWWVTALALVLVALAVARNEGRE